MHINIMYAMKTNTVTLNLFSTDLDLASGPGVWLKIIGSVITEL